MIVQASDNRGQYTRRTNVTVTVNVLRNQSPFFINEPYRLTISERSDLAVSLYRVTANDNDLLGDIVYTVLGDIPATSYFTVDSDTGVISATADLKLDTTLNYVVSIHLRFIIVSLVMDSIPRANNVEPDQMVP